MSNFEICVGIILKEEGGLSTNKDDPGRITKYGISARAYPHLDIRNLSKDAAVNIYRADYWNPIRCEELPTGVDLLVFNAAVNMGQVTAVKILQEAARVTIDGIIGNGTIQAVKAEMPHIIGEFCALQAWRYEINRNEETFGKGWFRRLFRMHQTALEWAS